MAKEIIGKYEIIEKIGQGGMGSVYKAKHPTLHRYVIIKQLTISKPSVIERFKREARLMMDLRHEHIVQVYDHFKEGKFYYIAMEYVDGMSLEELIEEKRYLSNEAAIIIFLEVCKGLKYAHDKGIIHRDIKPANILISKDGEIKLVDFGIAISKEDEDIGLTKEGATLGSPAYMSPEQIYDTKSVDKRADIYSMGISLYKMVTGRLPFPANISPETITMITKGKYTPPNKINPKIMPKILKVIKKCLKPKKRQRYKDLHSVISFLKSSMQKYSKGNENQNQKIICELIKSYIKGNEIESIKVKLPVKNRVRNFLKKILITSIILCIIFFILSFVLFKIGYGYEYLLPHKYGKIKFIIQSNNMTIEDNLKTCDGWIYLKTPDGKIKNNKPVKKIIFTKVRNDSLKNITLQSDNIFLKTDNYKVEINILNEKYQKDFFIEPIMMQRRSINAINESEIKINYRNIPSYQVDFNFNIKDFDTFKKIDEVETFIYIDARWIKFNDYISDAGNIINSGKNYTFLFKKEKYNDKKIDVYVNPYQTDCNITAYMFASSGTLSLKSDFDDLKIYLNNSIFYYKGNENKKFVRIQSTDLTILFNNILYFITGKDKGKYSKIQRKIFVNSDLILSPGTYMLTAARGKESVSQEINITSNIKTAIIIKSDKNKKIYFQIN